MAYNKTKWEYPIAEYDKSKTYNTGDYAYTVNDNKVYRCKSDGVTGDFNLTNWDETAYSKDKGTPVTSKNLNKIENELEELDGHKNETGNVHGLTASQITSGTLGIAQGGTGSTTASEALEKLGAAGKNHTHTPESLGAAKATYSNGKRIIAPDEIRLGTTGKMYESNGSLTVQGFEVVSFLDILTNKITFWYAEDDEIKQREVTAKDIPTITYKTATELCNKAIESDNEWHDAGEIVLQKGTYMINVHCEFADNANGKRVLALYTGKYKANAYNTARSDAQQNKHATNLKISNVISVSEETRYKVRVFQNSGDPINVSAFYEYIKIG